MKSYANCITPLRIGSLTTSTNLVLSPMSGITDCAFRSVVRRCSGAAVGLLVSEFIAAEGLTRDNAKTLSMLRYKEVERPISIQIFGADVDRMVRSACIVEECGADIVDINCGCPAPKVVKRGGGAQLLRMPERLRDILAGIRRAVSIPMTVKIRSGWDETCINAMEVARIAEGEGADMLSVHGRTRKQMYSGQADWDLVGRIRQTAAIPVVGSGDVGNAGGALTRLADGLADGVMIGRAALGNPWIFKQVQAVSAGVAVSKPRPAERVAALRCFRDVLREYLPEHAFVGRFRGMACRLVKGMRGGASARRAIGAAKSVDEVDAIFADFVCRGEARDLEAVA